MNFTSSSLLRRKKDTRRGIKFSIMTVGASGSGRTTFINCLLGRKTIPHKFQPVGTSIEEPKTLSFTGGKGVSTINAATFEREFNPTSAHEEPGIAITEANIELIDEDSKLLLTIIDTPGFGENIDNDVCFSEIISYLQAQFDNVLAEETRVRRNPKFQDTRVHVCLYFIPATGHGLRELDVETIKKLSKYVNVIPVITRADSFTEEELKLFKENIVRDIEKFNVPVFQFTYDEEEDDPETIDENKYLQEIQPFAVICSEDTFSLNGRKVRGRKYPWGFIDIDDPHVSDFSTLKSVLLGSHLQDLKDLTHDFLYENYRTEKLKSVPGVDEYDNNRDSFIPEPPTLSSLTKIAAQRDTIIFDNPQNFNFDASADNASLKTNETPRGISSNELKPPGTPNTFNSTTLPTSVADSPNVNRSQLRVLSETVPYALSQERIRKQQQRLEELEAQSAKELAFRAAALEKKAAELKAREQKLMLQAEKEKELKKKLLQLQEQNRVYASNLTPNSDINPENVQQ
ncbi:septin SHS1 [Ascoidea rubescens DSM 1968]|uniref:Septin n=1 Tax=Ascoidea rubescens DSM 1968 TaxID=1344418 RepID=A0A1D2VCW5_9ASCO|nr:Septin [Ascoidea rubescens DSM 1968]ODV59360.1 Septin [Ascoidea rubescens DSM 1968]